MARFKTTQGAALAATALLTLLPGCATTVAPEPASRTAFHCIDDSFECINKRQTLMRQLVADPSRAWMKEQPTPEAYASGVRLFAMKTKKHDLTCSELEQGRREADGAPASLRAAANRLPTAQVSRGIMFAGEVGRELSNEYGRRCKKA